MNDSTKSQPSPHSHSHHEYNHNHNHNGASSTETTPLPTVDPDFTNKYHSSPAPYAYGGRPTPSPISPCPWTDIRPQTLENNNYVHRRHHSEEAYAAAARYPGYNVNKQTNTDLIGGNYSYQTTKFQHNYSYNTASTSRLHQYMGSNIKCTKHRSYNAELTETETETETDMDAIFPDTPKGIVQYLIHIHDRAENQTRCIHT